MSYQSTSGIGDARRAYDTRPFVAQKLTGMSGEQTYWIRNDMDSIRVALQVVAEKRQATWSPFFACDELPVPCDGSDTPECRRELVSRNNAACDASDGLIIHGFLNGSTYIGHVQDAFLEAPIVKPVVVLRHASNHEFSRAWAGLEEEYPQLTILEFDSDTLPHVLSEWVAEHAHQMEQVTQARKAVDMQWQPVSDALVAAFADETPQAVDGLARSLGRTSESLLRLVQRPAALAALPTLKSTRLFERYGDLITERLTWSGAQTQFEKTELTAWKIWARNESNERAWSVLRHELAERERVGVNRNRPRLRSPDAWGLLSQRTPNA